MSASQGDDRLRTPPVERFAAEQHTFDLRTEVQALKAEHAPSSRGHRQKTLYKRGGATIALFRFERGGGLAPHKTSGTVTIHVIEGRMRIGTAGAPPHGEHILTADQLVVLAPDVEHDVHALEESTMLLQVHLDEANVARTS
jgi:quercetin dioxygenase-like cupin family protein